MTLSVTSYRCMFIHARPPGPLTPPLLPYGTDCAETPTTFAAPGTEAAEISCSSVRGHTARREATDSMADCLSASSDLDPPYPHSPSGVRGQGFPPSSARPVTSTWRFQPRINGAPMGQEALRVKRGFDGEWLVAPAAAETRSPSSPQDLPRASSCPSSLSSASQAIKEAAASHCCNSLWQEPPTINWTHSASRLWHPATAAAFSFFYFVSLFFDKLFYCLFPFCSLASLHFLHHILPQAANSLASL